MYRFRNWLSRVMTGRYGSDSFNRFLSAAALALLVLSILVRGTVGKLFWLLALALLILSYMRMLSRKTDRRQKENLRYMHYKYRITARFRGLKQRRKYRFFKCPSCGITARVPRGKGKIRITCPKCGHEFDARS